MNYEGHMEDSQAAKPVLEDRVRNDAYPASEQKVRDAQDVWERPYIDPEMSVSDDGETITTLEKDQELQEKLDAAHFESELLDRLVNMKDSKTPTSPRLPEQPPSSQQLNAASHTRYQYHSMAGEADQIRLVTINASHEQNGYINCDFERVRFKQLVGYRTYEAVSYAWGDPSLVHQVFCEECTSHIRATQSLMQILERLAEESRAAKESRVFSGNSIYSVDRRQFWIDGLCIDQLDAAERGEQVQMMANIYRRAKRVHIFLGAFEGETSLLEACGFRAAGSSRKPLPHMRVELHFKKDGTWQSLNGWDALVSDVLGPVKQISIALLPAARVVRDIFDATRTKGSGIFSLMLKFYAAQCSDDPDRLFALLGIANDVDVKDRNTRVPAHLAPFQALKMRFSPNYNLDTDQVYHAFALAALRSPLAFDILHCAGAFRLPDAADHRSLPSWVPDWRCPLLYRPFIGASDFQAGVVKSAGKRAGLIEEGALFIKIQGIVLGTVQELLEPTSKSDDHPIETGFAKVGWVNYGLSNDVFLGSIDLKAGRRVVKLTSGLTAVVPVDTAITDKVVTILGARTPFVLRGTENSENRGVNHILVGDCCVSETKIMNGEALKEALKEVTDANSDGERAISRSLEDYYIV